jgi:hypothetical protein
VRHEGEETGDDDGILSATRPDTPGTSTASTAPTRDAAAPAVAGPQQPALSDAVADGTDRSESGSADATQPVQATGSTQPVPATGSGEATTQPVPTAGPDQPGGGNSPATDQDATQRLEPVGRSRSKPAAKESRPRA